MYTQNVVDRKYSMEIVSNADELFWKPFIEFWRSYLRPNVYMEKYSDEWGYEIYGMDDFEFVLLCEHYKDLLLLNDYEFYVKYMLIYSGEYTPYVVRLRYCRLIKFASF